MGERVAFRQRQCWFDLWVLGSKLSTRDNDKRGKHDTSFPSSKESRKRTAGSSYFNYWLAPTSYPLVLTVWPNQKLLASAEASTRHTDVFITSPPTQHGHLTVQNSLSILFLPSFFSLPISYWSLQRTAERESSHSPVGHLMFWWLFFPCSCCCSAGSQGQVGILIWTGDSQYRQLIQNMS